MKVAVIGAGVMGSGIALCSIQAGYPTVLFDVNETALQRGMDYIQSQLNVAVSKGKTTQEKVDAALLLLSATPNRETLVADFIIEAVLEQLPIKRELFQFLETSTAKKHSSPPIPPASPSPKSLRHSNTPIDWWACISLTPLTS